MHANLFICLILFAVTAMVRTEIPSYIHICGRKNPQLNECIMKSIDSLRDKLRTGIPELDVPSAEPLIIPSLRLLDLPTIKADASDVKLHGLLNYTVDHLKIDFDAQTIMINVSFDKLFIDAEYDVAGKVLVMIQGKGPIHVDGLGVKVHEEMHYKLVSRKGTSYMYISSLTTKIHVDDFKAVFSFNEGEGNPTLASAINTALVDSNKEILETTTPHIEKVISEFVLNVSNKILKHFSFEELFPDRE